MVLHVLDELEMKFDETDRAEIDFVAWTEIEIADRAETNFTKRTKLWLIESIISKVSMAVILKIMIESIDFAIARSSANLVIVRSSHLVVAIA